MEKHILMNHQDTFKDHLYIISGFCQTHCNKVNMGCALWLFLSNSTSTMFQLGRPPLWVSIWSDPGDLILQQTPNLARTILHKSQCGPPHSGLLKLDGLRVLSIVTTNFNKIQQISCNMSQFGVSISAFYDNFHIILRFGSSKHSASGHPRCYSSTCTEEVGSLMYDVLSENQFRQSVIVKIIFGVPYILAPAGHFFQLLTSKYYVLLHKMFLFHAKHFPCIKLCWSMYQTLLVKMSDNVWALCQTSAEACWTCKGYFAMAALST